MTGSAPPRAELPTQYAPAEVEPALYARWTAAGVFTPDLPATGPAPRPTYCIVIPPPNVTGSLHIGHAFQHTLMDALTRRRRMQGHITLWLPGMDHAGISTQTVVERELAKEGRSRHDLGRAAFVERVWQWRHRYGGQILDQMRRLGDGVDWSRERFTMDDGLSRAVRTMFGRMYADGLVYRAERIINWCPRCLTALSDIEVEHSDDDGELVSIRYGPLTVATTRVETMLGDTAVAVHPDDDRYRQLVGGTVPLPLTGRAIPVVADDSVDPTFGTGAVKVTPAHDPNDFEIGRRHGLAAVTVLDERGVITAPGPFQGLDRYEARPAITAALREQGLVAAEQRPYRHAVGHCDRCKTVVEPRLSLQWFVDVKPLAKAAGDAVRDGRTAFSPVEMADRYFAWVDNMHDWCISRQLWWGHRIPVWYCGSGHATVPVGADDPDPQTCGDCGRTDLRQDEDVLDTWFSSGLWPFSTLGWPDRTRDLATFYPTDVLLTGYDIIFFWVARMMMFGRYVAQEGLPDVPFRTVVVTGLVRDGRGRKMSKSWGNVVDPLELIDRYGADALRFTLARGANPGTDVSLSEEWVQAGRNFVNKLWNAARFALLNGATVAGPPPAERLSVADRWVLSRLASVVEEVDRLYEDFQFAKLGEALFHFAWDEVFDWYLELAKLPLAAGGPPAEVTRAVLGHVFDVLLRLLHPIVPFVSERLWTALTGRDTVVTAPWPTPDPDRRDEPAELEVDRLRRLVTEVRRLRADQGLPPRRAVPAVLVGDPGPGGLTGWTREIGALATLRPLEVSHEMPAGWPVAGTAVASIGLDLTGAVDLTAERARLDRARAAAQRERDTVSARLADADFVARAPGPVVERMRERLAAALAELERLADIGNRGPADLPADLRPGPARR